MAWGEGAQFSEAPGNWLRLPNDPTPPLGATLCRFLLALLCCKRLLCVRARVCLYRCWAVRKSAALTSSFSALPNEPHDVAKTPRKPANKAM
jgi:hypothetical protein